MEAVWIIGGYLLACAAIYLLMAFLCRKDGRFPVPPAPVYYILSFLWGFPVTLAGCLAALVFRLSGYVPEKKGYNWFFQLKKVSWGLSLGIFAFVPKGSGERMFAHEHGHGLQNAWLGPFMPFVVMIPSAVRFWSRFIRERSSGRKPERKYDDIWFEGSATRSGTKALSVGIGKDGLKRV